MLKIFKSKTFIGIICLLLAAVIAFLLLPRFYAARSTVRSVVRVSKDVPAGTMLTADMLSTAEVGAYGLSEKTVANVGDAVGFVALDNLYAGEYLWSDRIATAEDYKAKLSEKTKGLSGSNCLVTIEFPTASAGIASVLRAGNIVDVYEHVEGEDRATLVSKCLSGLYVYDVLNQKLESLDELDRKRAEAVIEEDTDYDFIPKYVVFRCSQTQAETLIRLEKMDAFHLTLRKTEG